MTHGSLFSGIGGFDLAAEWMGWTNVFHCEWEQFPRQVLKYHFPNSISYGDIKETDFTIHRGRIDILTGGFPCQPYSSAGKRLGKEDDRHLWPQMLRSIAEIQPRFVVGENVRGLVNWNGGLVFDEVQIDLEAEGYQVQPFILPACAVNAPHRRDRVWFVAYSDGADAGNNGRADAGTTNEFRGVGDASDTSIIRCGRRGERSEADQEQRHEMGESIRQHRNGVRSEAAGCGAVTPDTNSQLSQGGCGSDRSKATKRHVSAPFHGNTWENFPTQPPICGGDDGLPKELDGIAFSKWRKESIKAYGNAIVPQVALQIFKAIQQYHL